MPLLGIGHTPKLNHDILIHLKQISMFSLTLWDFLKPHDWFPCNSKPNIQFCFQFKASHSLMFRHNLKTRLWQKYFKMRYSHNLCQFWVINWYWASMLTHDLMPTKAITFCAMKYFLNWPNIMVGLNSLPLFIVLVFMFKGGVWEAINTSNLGCEKCRWKTEKKVYVKFSKWVIQVYY